MDKTTAGLLLLAVVVGIPSALKKLQDFSTPSKEDKVELKCPKCGSIWTLILIGKHC